MNRLLCRLLLLLTATLIVELAPARAAKFSPSQIINSPNPILLGGFGAQVAIGDGYIVGRSAKDGSVVGDQEVHVFSSNNGALLRSITVPGGVLIDSLW